MKKQTADDHSVTLSPQSPPDHERGQQPLEYVPKSPVYPPNDSSENAKFSSIPDLETPREQMSPVQGKLKEPDQATHMTVPADANADMDHFKDTDRHDMLRQQLDKELNEVPWNQDASQKALKQMETVVKTVKPADEGFWHQNDSDILNKLNEAAKKLKDRHAEMKKDTINESSQKEDQVSPSDKCFTCHHPVGHHLLKCSKTTLQHDLKEIMHEVPVEPLKGAPKIVHPFSATRPQTLLMPPPSVPANFTVKLNKVTKMKTDSASTKAKMVTAMATQPQVMI